MSSISAKRLVFDGKQQVRLESFLIAEPSFGEVRVKSAYSLMSTGTENIIFNRNFDPNTHWDQWVKYPFLPGYTTVGTVEALGEGSKLHRGDRVAFRTGHCSHALVLDQDCHLIPDAIAFERAIWFSLGKIAFNGALAADYRLGDSVLIIGAGPIGQMSLRWARAAGAAFIAVIEPMSQRTAFALSGGANLVINVPADQARERLLEGGGSPPRIVIDSTGNAAVFATALSLAADRGRIVLLGDTGSPSKQFLTSDVITRGLMVIGAHGSHCTDRWNDSTITKLFFTMLADGRFPLSDLNTHIFKPDAASEAYLVANRDRAETMGILFDWREIY